MQKIMQKNFLISFTIIFFLSITSALALTPKDTNTLQIKKYSNFIDGDFDEIVRFDEIYMYDVDIKEDSKSTLKDVVDKVKTYTNKSNEIIVNIIGYSFKSSNALEKSKENALSVQAYLSEHGIDKNIMRIEYRGAKDPLHLSADHALSNRAIVTMYVTLAKDLDQDGVLREQDKCPDTQRGMKVGEDGCKIKTLIVLLPDKKTNSSILIATDKSSVAVTKPNQIVSVRSKDSAPSNPKEIDTNEIKNLFGEIIDATNTEQLSYILYFNKLELTEESKENFQNILSILSKMQSPYIQLIGHTDTVGNSNSNKTLGSQRTQSVANTIQSAEITYLKIDQDTYGESDLAIPTDDNMDEQFNRRVELFIH
ncbi:MAG: outer membrane protein OmpA-like peptidoglycan-associated protein [Sulfurimonas sp.]|jgi:outer membrane protein OmpA-like peptidoglycan-associated protein|uniref:OmpA family protein n=1 Tax=Sulfurimonas sp. TaxID=2022749 RepID=UPI0039E2A35D